MKGKSGTVLYGIAIFIGVVGILLFLSAPAISIRPSVLGIDAGKEIKLEYSVLEIRSGLISVNEMLEKNVPLEQIKSYSDRAQGILNFISGDIGAEYEKAVNVVESWAKFPFIFTTAISVAIAGMVIAVIFSAIGLCGIRKKYVAVMISSGAGIFLASMIGIALWLGIQVYRLYVLVSALSGYHLLDFEDILCFSVSFDGNIGKAVAGCIGIGFILTLLCAIGLITTGVLLFAAGNTAEETASKGAHHENVQAMKKNGIIRFLNGEYAGYELELYPGEGIRMGGSPSLCQVIFSQKGIPACQCEIRCERNEENHLYFVIRNCSNERIRIWKNELDRGEQASVKPGTRIMLEAGKTEFVVEE